MTVPPFLPYARQTLDDDDVEAVVRVLRGDFLTTGPAVAAFERDLAAAVGSEWAVAVGSGTGALHAACVAAGVGPGDEVIVPAVTFVATANCARFEGAEPVFADVDPDTGLVRPESVAERVTAATRAIIAVHLGGASADVPALAAVAAGAGATLIEDAAHALGGHRNGTAVGACADGSAMSIFSFHTVKQVTTGEGGAVTGRGAAPEHLVRLCRDHGLERDPARFRHESPGPWYYEQHLLGHNLRLTDIQAALGSSQLKKLGAFVNARQRLASAYDARLREVPGVQAVVPPAARGGCAYHLYQVLIDFAGIGRSRADVVAALRNRGIGTQVHYIPVPMQPYYRERGWAPDRFPGALRFYERTLSLPLFPAMRDEDVDRVVDALRAVLHGGG
jgi:UDP-4-amino-4,6-dideoxy-N-acetyl-beta-L-altrosamine transaminase